MASTFELAKAVRASARKWLTLRFSLRNFLLVVLVLGVILGWAGNLLVKARQKSQVLAQIRAVEGRALYRRAEKNPVTGRDRYNERPPPGPFFIRHIFGDEVFADVEFVDFSSKVTSDSSLELLQQLPRLHTVLVYGPKVSDRGVGHLAGIANLQALNLFDTSVTADGLRQLAAARNLRELNLYGSAVNNDTLQGLEALRGLVSMQLCRTRVTSEGLEACRGLENLEGLNLLKSAEIGDEGLRHIIALPRLRYLNLFGTDVTDIGLEELPKISNLQGLDLGFTKVTDAGMQHVARISQLKDLRLNVEIGDAGVHELRALRKLQVISLKSSKVTDAACPDLAELAELRSLDLMFTAITDEGLRHLAKSKNLKRLSVGPNVSESAADALKLALPECRIHVKRPSGGQKVIQ
jgi:hypothetical protein